MRFTTDDEAYEFTMLDFLQDVERTAAEVPPHWDEDGVIAALAAGSGIGLVGTILDQAHDAWARGVAMV